MHACICVCVCATCLYVCAHACVLCVLHVCMCVHMRVCVHECVHVCIVSVQYGYRGIYKFPHYCTGDGDAGVSSAVSLGVSVKLYLLQTDPHPNQLMITDPLEEEQVHADEVVHDNSDNDDDDKEDTEEQPGLGDIPNNSLEY